MFVGAILLFCMVHNIYAQAKEAPSNKGTGHFRKLELAHDSTQYAHELFSIAQYCRRLGM